MKLRDIVIKAVAICLVIILFVGCSENNNDTNELVNEDIPIIAEYPEEHIEFNSTETENTEKREEIEECDSKNDLISLGEFKLTAYCACLKCCGKTDGITATGTKATQGRTIAVDPKVIPYGSEVIINGHTYIAEDCGGAIKNNRIDVYFDSHQEALNFGVQYAEVFLSEN